jgi:hypothetical protein
VPGGTGDRRIVAWALCAVSMVPALAVVCPVRTWALGALQHPSIEQSAACVRGILFYASSAGGVAGTSSLRVELSEIVLYGVSGLRIAGARVGGRAGAASLVANVARLSADVGSETRIALTPAVFLTGRWAASLGLVYESAAIDGMQPARLASATGRSLVILTRAVAVGGEVAGYRLSGEDNDGADVTMAVVVTPLAGATIRAVIAMGRRSNAQAALSATVCASGRFRVTIGYEAWTEALKGAVAVSLGGLTCAAGVHIHPVLGVRQGVSLAWGR